VGPVGRALRPGAWERFRAWGYDLVGAGFERRHGYALRAPHLSAARGSVLEIGVGTGANLPHYPEPVGRLVGADPSLGMLARARRRAAALETDVEFVQAPAEALPFPDSSFDTVVSTLTLCTVRRQDAALREIARVLRPNATFLFAEHVRADDPRLARWQDRLEGVWTVVAGGCHPNRDTLRSVEAAGFTVEELERAEIPGAPAIVRPCVIGRARRPSTQ
jgi:ubiquinone/menaquinone biosynthesis C-methylase UbiE